MYFCELCDYCTENRNLIENHHIIPKELKGSDNSFNRVYLCGICHSKIVVEGSMFGKHSIRNDESIVIKGWFKSTEGDLLLIESPSNNQKYIEKKNKL